MFIIQKTVMVNMSSCLHARPTSQLVNFAQKYPGSVSINHSGKQGDLKSILNVLAMGVVKGSEITIEVIGEDEEKFACELLEYIEKLVG